MRKSKGWFTGGIVVYKGFSIDLKNKKEIYNVIDDLEKSLLVVGEAYFDEEGECKTRFKKEYRERLDRKESEAALNSTIKTENRVGDNTKLNPRLNSSIRNIIGTISDEDKDPLNYIHTTTLADEPPISALMYEKEYLLGLTFLDEQNQLLSLREFGGVYTNLRNHYVLQPVEAVLMDEEKKCSLCYLTLDIFSNGMGVIKLFMPTKEYPLSLIESQDIEEYFESFSIPDAICLQDCDEVSLGGILKAYLKAIGQETHRNIFCGDTITNYVLGESSYKLKTFKKLTSKVKESLFCLINGPYNHKSTIKKDSETFFEKQVFGKDYIRVLVSTKGKCITICEENREVVKIDEVPLKEQFPYRTLRGTQYSELAITTILLRKLNYQMTYKRLQQEKDYTKVLRQFRSGEDFIQSLQEECYGSVNEEIEFFEKTMKYYIAEKVYLQKIRNVETNLKEESERNLNLLSIFAGFFTLIFTIFFGLPLISNTYNILFNNETVSADLHLTNCVPILVWIMLIVLSGFIGGKQVIRWINKWRIRKYNKKQKY